jgi:DNA-binding transcriptional ArsR family regulator
MAEKIVWSIKSDDEMKKILELTESEFPKIKDIAELQNIAAFFKGLGDDTRLRIIALLWMEDMCMCEITSALDAASSTISHHLKIMEKGEVISSRREGKFTIYRLNKEKVNPVMVFLFK